MCVLEHIVDFYLFSAVQVNEGIKLLNGYGDAFSKLEIEGVENEKEISETFVLPNKFSVSLLSDRFSQKVYGLVWAKRCV
tara:strand:+ start:1294 stop:1533 length:240 start_codon:yes stop_codon:yes gene_type:complete